MRAFVLALAFTSSVPLAAHAGQTPWQEVAPDVRMRLISSGTIEADGRTRFAFEIDMPENTKTYWRVPGDTGLPTELDFSGSKGVEEHAIDWPFPVRDLQAGYLDYVYFGHTVIPVTITTDGPAPHLELAATLGICSEICIPAQAKFSMPLRDTTADMPNGLRIRQALADVPLAWPEEAPAIATVEWSKDGQGIVLGGLDPAVDPQSIIASTASGDPLFGTPQKSPQAGLVLLPIRGKNDNSAGQVVDIHLTFMTDRGPYEMVRKVGASVTAQ